MDWSTSVWRLLCLLAIMSGLAVFTPVWSVLPLVIQGIAAVPGLLVTLLLVVASVASSIDSSASPAPLTHESSTPDVD